MEATQTCCFFLQGLSGNTCLSVLWFVSMVAAQLLFHVSSFLGLFAKLRKANISLIVPFCLCVCPSVCPSARMEQLASHWTDYREIWYLRICQNSVQIIQVSLKSDKNSGYVKWRPMCFMVIYPSLSLRIRIIFRQICRENWNTNYTFNNVFFRKIYRSRCMWENVVQSSRTQMET